MKIKLNWGSGVVIAMALFMIFILSFVYKSVVMDKYQHELMSEDYYGDELHYQEEIDKVNKATTLEKDVSIIRSDQGILVQFPENLDEEMISGSIRFLRPSNKKLDFDLAIDLNNFQQLIPDKQLVSGKYLIIIDWKHDTNAYMFKDDLFY